MTPTPFKQKTAIQIRFKDIDMMGHVNNANYITYFELARLTYFDSLKDEGVKIDWVCLHMGIKDRLQKL